MISLTILPTCIVCLHEETEEYSRCGEFGLTRAQGYSFEQAMQKALDLLKFKENNDLLYMNELKGYYKEEPDYFDGEYQKKILALIGKSKIVIPESCVGDAVKATLEKNRPKVSQSQSNALGAPTESTPSRWRRKTTHSPSTNPGMSSSGPHEAHNSLSQAFASLSTKISGSGRKDDRLSTPSSATREHEERHRAAQISERRDIPPTAATTSTAPPRRTSSISSPSTNHFVPRDPMSLGTRVLTRPAERQEGFISRRSVTSTPAAVGGMPASRESRVAARAAIPESK